MSDIEWVQALQAEQAAAGGAGNVEAGGDILQAMNQKFNASADMAAQEREKERKKRMKEHQ